MDAETQAGQAGEILAEREQIERLRDKAYAFVSANPTGPLADKARAFLARAPKASFSRGFNQPGVPKDIVHGELSGGDDFGPLPQTPDESVGIPNKMRSLSLPEKAALVAASPPTRHQFERGVADTVTFGLANKAARATGDPAWSREQETEDATIAPNARPVGELVGSILPGATNLAGQIGQGVGRNMAGWAGRGILGRGLAGGVGGAAGNAVAMPLIAGGQAAVAGENVPEAMKREVANPATYILGGGLGLIGGMGRGIRDTGQTGRDIRLVEGYEAKPTPFGGAKGGVFKSPLLSDLEGTAGEQGQASRRAAEGVMTGLEGDQAKLERQYGAEKAAARDQGFLEGRISTEAVRADVMKLLARERLTTGQKSAIQTEVIDALDRHPGGMTLDDLNDLRAKVGDIFGTGPRDAAHPALDTVRQSIKRAVDDTEMGPINENYHKGRQRIERQHEQLGLTEGGRRDVQERRLANLIQRRANDEAPGAGIQEAGDLGTEQFLKENPRFTPSFDTARLLAAKERMSFGMEPEAGFHRRMGHHLLTKNLEPGLVGLYRLGSGAERLTVPASLAARYYLGGQ